MKRLLLLLVLILPPQLAAQTSVIYSLSPSSTTAGGPAFTLTVTGSFAVACANPITFNNIVVTGGVFTYASIQVTIPATSITAIKNVPVQYVCGGFQSQVVYFPVVSPIVQPTSYVPTYFVAGQNTPVTVYGQGFLPGAVILFDNVAQTTTFVNSGQLTASIPGTSILYSSGNHKVLVYNGGGGGGSSTPAVSFSPTSCAFGNQAVGTPSSICTVTVTSSGTANLAISSISKSGTNAADFSQGGTCTTTTYAPGRTCLITSIFTPSGAGAETASINVADNAAGSPQAIGLGGTGVAGHYVVLTWTASVSTGVLGYNVYRSTVNGGPYARLNATFLNAVTYTDSGVSSGNTYYYVVTAVGNSSYSNTESIYSNQYTAVIP